MILKRLLVKLLVAGLLFVPAALYAQARALKKVQVGVPAISMGNIIS